MRQHSVAAYSARSMQANIPPAVTGHLHSVAGHLHSCKLDLAASMEPSYDTLLSKVVNNDEFPPSPPLPSQE